MEEGRMILLLRRRIGDGHPSSGPNERLATEGEVEKGDGAEVDGRTEDEGVVIKEIKGEDRIRGGLRSNLKHLPHRRTRPRNLRRRIRLLREWATMAPVTIWRMLRLTRRRAPSPLQSLIRRLKVNRRTMRMSSRSQKVRQNPMSRRLNQRNPSANSLPRAGGVTGEIDAILRIP